MENNKIIISMEQQFGEVIDIILQQITNYCLQRGMLVDMYQPN